MSTLVSFFVAFNTIFSSRISVFLFHYHLFSFVFFVIFSFFHVSCQIGSDFVSIPYFHPLFHFSVAFCRFFPSQAFPTFRFHLMLVFILCSFDDSIFLCFTYSRWIFALVEIFNFRLFTFWVSSLIWISFIVLYFVCHFDFRFSFWVSFVILTVVTFVNFSFSFGQFSSFHLESALSPRLLIPASASRSLPAAMLCALHLTPSLPHSLRHALVFSTAVGSSLCPRDWGWALGPRAP